MRAKILNASAGSGKTYQLAYKYVCDVVRTPDIYRNILAVTFTNKATEEMKSRILKEIHRLASGAESPYLQNLCDELKLDAATVRKRAGIARSKILHDYSRFTILTIDTFFQRILRAFIKELGIDLDYNIEIETDSVLSKSADTLIEQITSDRDLLRWLTAFVEERIEEGEKWNVREGILSLGGELFKEKNKSVLSAACSKEELERIIARSKAAAEHSKKELRDTAAEAVRIISEAGLSINDFKGKSTSFANYFYKIADGELKPYSPTVGKMSLTCEGWCPKGSPAEPFVAQLQPLLRKICDLYDGNIRQWNTCDLLTENYRSFALLSDLYAKVQQMCDEQNMMLLSETKYILSEFISHNDAPFIYEKVGNRYDRYMIDEFQDTSVREWENFLPLLLNAMSQSNDTSVVIVGDIKQSIYRWRGGDWRLLHDQAQKQLEAQAGKGSTQVVNLKANYRSLPVIVAFNNDSIGRIIRDDNRLLNEKITTAAEQGDMSAADAAELQDTLLDAYREHAQTPCRKAEHPGYVSIETFAERPPVVARICELLDKGFRPSDIMILVRSATDGAKVAAELLDFKSRNTDSRYRFDVMTQEALIVGNAPVSSFVAATMRLTLNADDTMNRAVYNHYLSLPFDRSLDDDERTFFRSARLLSPEEAFERIVIRYHLQDNTRQTAYLQAIHEQIIAFCANKIADIPLFLRWWEEQGCNRSLNVEQSTTTVEITTIHKAKGLEKRAVIIPYCSWQLEPKSSGAVNNIVWAEADKGEAEQIGRFPVRYKKSMSESSFSAEYYRELVYAHVDNINLLYVALTRAAESLHIFIPQKGSHSVGNLLLQSIAIDGDKALLENQTGRYVADETGDHFSFGEFTGPVAENGQLRKTEHVIQESYPTSRAELRLRLPSQRYFEDTDEVHLSPRDFGILMHKAFETADDVPAIESAVEQMIADGSLSASDAAELRARIQRTLENPIVRDWFGGRWQCVRNENAIIRPGDSTTRRPDRVMTDGTQAVVVDYKFGSREPERYRRQIREYIQLLQQMGYTHVEGYLWYVRLGNIEKVEP